MTPISLPSNSSNATTQHKYHQQMCPKLDNDTAGLNATFWSDLVKIKVHHNITDAETSKSKRPQSENRSFDDTLRYSIIVLMALIGVTSVFSRNLRCSMLLILPGLLTGRSRTFLFTLIMNLLFKYPMSSIHVNIGQMMNSAGWSSYQ